MEEESCHNNSHTSKTSSSCSKLQIEEANYEDSNEHIQYNHWNQEEELNNMPYRINISITKPFMTFMLDDVWSCIVVLVVEQNNKPKPGLMLYGFDYPPPLDVKINWTEMYDTSISAKSQKACSNFDWIFYLNKGSQLDIFYNVKSLGAPLFLVIAKGSGIITQKISHSSTYYVAIGNMSPQNVKVQLNFSVNALLYNTSGSYQRCSLDYGLCTLNPALSANTALLTTPGPRKD
ncbi:hypothetical protein TSUD_126520 [Trifolium subterraneum]|uniref:Uncharacterized protein n=1 Tax=Trifolium subterraneum TaxID=3900 RepID=A0A2Z6M6E4_TRISU|nr:hypothetical protein TSUD_126520 [Trifolium subterraneum]